MSIPLGACLRRAASIRILFLKASLSLCPFPLSGGVLPGVHRASLADRCRRFLLCRTMSSCTSSYPDRCAKAHRPLCLACMTAEHRLDGIDHGPGQRLARRQGCRRWGGGLHAGFGCRRWKGTERVDSRIVLAGGLWCPVHVMNGFEVWIIYQRERGPVGPLTQPLHDILTWRGRRGCSRCVPCAGSLSLGRSALTHPLP